MKNFLPTVFFLLLIIATTLYAQDSPEIILPQPEICAEKPIIEILKSRRTCRSYELTELPEQTLANLLWAAFGVSDTTSGKRTAPSPYNWKQIDIYVALSNGLFLYNAPSHQLVRILDEDIRALTGWQKFVGEAPVNLIYVSDYSKMNTKIQPINDEKRYFFSAISAGIIAENVYLFCTAEGLGTVVRDWVKREPLQAKMNLPPDKKIILVQTVGFPKK